MGAKRLTAEQREAQVKALVTAGSIKWGSVVVNTKGTRVVSVRYWTGELVDMNFKEFGFFRDGVMAGSNQHRLTKIEEDRAEIRAETKETHVCALGKACPLHAIEEGRTEVMTTIKEIPGIEAYETPK